MKYFTIKTFEHAGLGDQLGTQFARLFLVGQGLGLTYRHQEFKINRSCTSNYKIFITSNLLKIKTLGLRASENFSWIKYLLPAILITEKVLLKFELNNNLNKKLKQFLGLADTEEIVNEILKLDLTALINASNHAEELLKNIMSIDKYSTYQTLELEWLPNYYDYTYKLDSIFNSGNTINFNNYLKEKFHNQNVMKLSQNQNKTFLIHIRCGDSVTINCSHGAISLYGTEISFLDTESEKSLVGDINRSSLGIKKYTKVLDELNIPKDWKVVVLSDGYALSKSIIADHYIKQFSKLENYKKQILSEILKLNLNQDLLFEPLKKYNPSYIIGESFSNLKESIFALANAKIVFFGTGGFAYYLHSIYKTQSNTFLGHANEKFEIITEQFNDKLQEAK